MPSQSCQRTAKSHVTNDGSTPRRCTVIVTNERARLSSVRKKNSVGVAFICVAKHHSPRQCWYNCKITVHPRKLYHRHYYFNREVSHWLQYTTSQFRSVHVPRLTYLGHFEQHWHTSEQWIDTTSQFRSAHVPRLTYLGHFEQHRHTSVLFGTTGSKFSGFIAILKTWHLKIQHRLQNLPVWCGLYSVRSDFHILHGNRVGHARHCTARKQTGVTEATRMHDKQRSKMLTQL